MNGSNEHQNSLNEQRISLNEQIKSSNEQQLSSNEQKSSNEHKVSSNQQKIVHVKKLKLTKNSSNEHIKSSTLAHCIKTSSALFQYFFLYCQRN